MRARFVFNSTRCTCLGVCVYRVSLPSLVMRKGEGPSSSINEISQIEAVLCALACFAC